VDDGGIFCETVLEKTEIIEDLSIHFVVKDLGNIEKFVGCKKINNKTKASFYIHQPKLLTPLTHIKQEFRGLLESLKEFQTPAPPRTMVNCLDKQDILISVDQKTKYRSGVGMLLYLVRHTEIDITNSDRTMEGSR
jgi:hypothetical protein